MLNTSPSNLVFHRTADLGIQYFITRHFSVNFEVGGSIRNDRFTSKFYQLQTKQQYMVINGNYIRSISNDPVVIQDKYYTTNYKIELLFNRSKNNLSMPLGYYFGIGLLNSNSLIKNSFNDFSTIQQVSIYNSLTKNYEFINRKIDISGQAHNEKAKSTSIYCKFGKGYALSPHLILDISISLGYSEVNRDYLYIDNSIFHESQKEIFYDSDYMYKKKVNYPVYIIGGNDRFNNGFLVNPCIKIGYLIY
jgi:hypothetical protein